MEKLKELFAKLKDFVVVNKGYLLSILCALVLLVVMAVAASKCEVSQQPPMVLRSDVTSEPVMTTDASVVSLVDVSSEQ